MPLTPNQWRGVALEAARAQEFELAGVAAVEQFPFLDQFAAWIGAGRGGEMTYLARPAAAGDAYMREDVRHVCPWARSVICCGALYNGAPPEAAAMATGHDRGWISRYAWGDDYHQTLRQRLEAVVAAMRRPLEAQGETAEFQITVDTFPLVERAAARAAGIGWQGKNTCLIHPQQGSFYFLGCVVTSIEIAADSPLPDRCGSCTRCIDACPTGALDQPYQMDASRCLSYLNIERRGALPEEFRAAMGHQLLGCDICQDVCPWNRRAPVSLRPEFAPRPGLLAPELEELAAMSVEDYRERFRHSAVKRAKYPGLMRNVAVAIGNSGNPRLRPALEKLAAHEDLTVQEHARWGLDRLSRTRAKD